MGRVKIFETERGIDQQQLQKPVPKPGNKLPSNAFEQWKQLKGLCPTFVTMAEAPFRHRNRSEEFCICWAFQFGTVARRSGRAYYNGVSAHCVLRFQLLSQTPHNFTERRNRTDLPLFSLFRRSCGELSVMENRWALSYWLSCLVVL